MSEIEGERPRTTETRRFGKARRTLLTGLATAAMTAGLFAATDAPAFANAAGCTSYGSNDNCIFVDGSGLYVSYVTSSFRPHAGATIPLCSRYHDYKYWFPGYYYSPAEWRHHFITIGQCTAHPTDTDYATWYTYQNFPNHKQICTSTMNPQTYYAWTGYACETVHS